MDKILKTLLCVCIISAIIWFGFIYEPAPKEIYVQCLECGNEYRVVKETVEDEDGSYPIYYFADNCGCYVKKNDVFNTDDDWYDTALENAKKLDEEQRQKMYEELKNQE